MRSHIGDSLKEMIALDIKSEEVAIKLYKQIIELAEKEGDITTAHMIRGILAQEEEHHDTFTTLAEAV